MSAKEGYRAYVRSYESHSLKHIFDVQTLDLKAVGKSFGFSVPPHIDIGVAPSKKLNKMRKKEDFKDKKAKIYRQGMPKGKKGQFSR